MNGYKLTENWFAYMAENSKKVECKHTAMYFYIVELFNKRQWVEVVGLPTDFTMSILNIKSYKTYKKTFEDLIDFGFVKLVEKSINQHTSNKIALVKKDKASSKHIPKQVETNDQCEYSIYKQLNSKQINKILSYFNSIKVSDIDIKIEDVINSDNDLPPTAKPKTFKDFTKEDFHAEIKKFVEQYSKETCRAFFDYWIEPDAKGKMRFQLEKTWATKNRLNTWKSNEGKFGKNSVAKKEILTMY